MCPAGQINAFGILEEILPRKSVSFRARAMRVFTTRILKWGQKESCLRLSRAFTFILIFAPPFSPTSFTPLNVQRFFFALLMQDIHPYVLTLSLCSPRNLARDIRENLFLRTKGNDNCLKFYMKYIVIAASSYMLHFSKS